MSTLRPMWKASSKQLWCAWIMAMLATFFTNLEAVPGMATLSMACCCFLAESMERLWLFFLCLLPIGLVMGISTWGYLQEAALVLCVVMQLPLSVAYLVHRSLLRRHPELWSVTLAFPSLHTALWILSFLFLPIGSIASPAYDVAGQLTIFTQCSAWLGRSCVTFVLSWLAATSSHRCASSSGAGLKGAVAALLLLSLAGGLRFYASSSLGSELPEPEDYLSVSCLSDVDDVYEATAQRLSLGDHVVMHTERGTDNLEPPVKRYQELLLQHYQKTTVEALVVLSFVENQRSWYHLVTKNGSMMSYAKNHPVPFVENDILPGTKPPFATSVLVGNGPISVTGTICFDTDFPWLTRQLSNADLLLETSETWSYIGRQHLRGHEYTALENGQTLVKCTQHGYTGVIDPYGSIIEQIPQDRGVVRFQVPRFAKLRVFPMLYLAFDSLIGLAACTWLWLSCSPQLSARWLGRCHF